MPERVRVLNDDGARLFREFVERAKAGSTEAAPRHLLADARTSAPFEPEVFVEDRSFGSRQEFGQYLTQALARAARRRISREAGLWNWLALFYFDQLCPPDGSGRRRVLDADHYVLEGRFAYTRYYRHLVRFAWFAVSAHGDDAKAMLAAAGKGAAGIGQWGDMSEQLGGYQGIFGSRTVQIVAARLFLDEDGGVIRGAASRSGPGSVRRLATVLKQFSLTYDLRTAQPDAVIRLLPPEFERFRRDYLRRTGQAPRARPDDGAGQWSFRSLIRRARGAPASAQVQERE